MDKSGSPANPSTSFSKDSLKMGPKNPRYLEKSKYYLANILSSYSSIKENQSFFLQSNLNITYDLFIYDRWGNNLFKSLNATSNDYLQGWIPEDTFDNGIFVYMIYVHEPSGDVLITGDLFAH